MMNFGKDHGSEELLEDEDGSTSQMKVKLLDDLIAKLEGMGGEDEGLEMGPDMNQDPSKEGLGVSKTKIEIEGDPEQDDIASKLKGLV
jgi:hypothetical protein